MQVWTNDLDKGAEIASKIQSGMRGVNAHPGSGPNTPFGGVKQSGIGVEGAGKLGLKEFVDVTTLRVAKTGAPHTQSQRHTLDTQSQKHARAGPGLTPDGLLAGLSGGK